MFELDGTSHLLFWAIIFGSAFCCIALLMASYEEPEDQPPYSNLDG